MLSNIVAMVDGVPEHRSPEVYAWGTWKEEADTKAPERAKTTEIGEDERIQLGYEDRSNIHVGHDANSAIQETQTFDMNKWMYTNITSLAKEGDGFRRYENYERCHLISPPRRHKT